MGRETDRPNLLQPTWPKGFSMAFSKGSLKDARGMKRRCSPGYRGCRRGALAAVGNPEDRCEKQVDTHGTTPLGRISQADKKGSSRGSEYSHQ
jgi:hypothetical protein